MFIYLEVITYSLNNHNYCFTKIIACGLSEFQLFVIFPIQVYYTKDNESRKNMLHLDDFLMRLHRRWVERTVFTRTNEKFSISIEEIPPIIAPSLTGSSVNMEMDKKSIYLKSSKPTGLVHNMTYNITCTTQHNAMYKKRPILLVYWRKK